MTNEEAIALLKQVQIYTARSASKASIAEALGLAISALEHEFKGMLIICDNCGHAIHVQQVYPKMSGDDVEWIRADMRKVEKEEEETDCDYQRAIEQLEHDILYEPTFNPDDGSM